MRQPAQAGGQRGAARLDGTRDPGVATTLGEFAQLWRPTIRHLAASTRAGYETKLRVQVLPAFGDLQLEAITPLRIRTWAAELQSRGLSRHTVRQAKQVLGALLELALEERLLVKNPAATVRIVKAVKQEQHFLSDAQISRLAQAIDPR